MHLMGEIKRKPLDLAAPSADYHWHFFCKFDHKQSVSSSPRTPESDLSGVDKPKESAPGHFGRFPGELNR